MGYIATACLITPSTASRVGQAACVSGNSSAQPETPWCPRQFFLSTLGCDHGAMAATQAASKRNFDASPSNVTFAVSCAESRCLRTLRPFLTHFDPQRHCRPDGTRRMTADQSVPLRTGTGRRPEQTATSISTQYPQSRYTTINQADISVWHDTRFSKVPPQQLIPVTDAKLHGK
jgi:hypothetical protein